MSKYDAFGTGLALGIRQVDTATAVGACTGSGNMHVVITSDDVAGSPLQTVVAITNGDSADTWAEKVRVALAAVPAITTWYAVGGSGPYITLTRQPSQVLDNDASLNIDVHKDSATGPTDDATSTHTVAGIADTSIAAVKNLGGPGLALDTVDVTTHDSTAAYEELVATILRTGELNLEIVYDPVADTHDFTATTGLGYALKNKTLCSFTLTFSDAGSTHWHFPGFVTGFEPGEPVDDGLTANVTIKITGVPTLA